MYSPLQKENYKISVIYEQFLIKHGYLKFFKIVIKMKQMLLIFFVCTFACSVYGTKELIEKILEHHDKCSKCELQWVNVVQSFYVPNTNARICRALKDRYIVGELQLDKYHRPYCKIPFYSRAENMYQFEILTVNNKEVRELSQGNINDFPGDESSNTRHHHCKKAKLHDLLDSIHKH